MMPTKSSIQKTRKIIKPKATEQAIARTVSNHMEARLAKLSADKEFSLLVKRVDRELAERFYGTYCDIEVTGTKLEYLQSLSWLYRQAEWVLNFHQRQMPHDENNGHKPPETQDFIRFAARI